jgi:23S rRNA (pseudouridine1915-N3)-methyltransferase
MRIHLIAVGRRMPRWVTEGYDEFSRRLPPQCAMRLVEINPGKRGKGADLERIRREEGERILAAVPTGARIVALDLTGQGWDTRGVAGMLAGWMQGGRDVALLVGGPEGLSDACLRAAEGRWSLSPLTFPHGLVRVVVAEQIYRASTVLGGHPYHR